jgi:hypothetical protein
LLAGHHLPMAQFGWILAVVVELGGGLAIVFGLITRPVGLVLAIWCVATALIAHTNFADRNQEIKHGDDGRVSLRRGVRCPRLESRRVVVAPRRRSGPVEGSPRIVAACVAGFAGCGLTLIDPWTAA